MIVQVLVSVLTLGIIRVESFFGFKKLGILNSPLHSSIDLQPQYNFSLVLKNGIIDYIGETNIDDLVVNFYNESFNFKPTTRWQLVRTRFNLWKQLPWRKIKGKIILKASVSGSLSVTPSKLPGLFSSVSPSYAEQVSSLHDLMNLFVYAAHDPRVQAIYLELGPLTCGYAKLAELRRYIMYFQKSGKKVMGYSDACSEKEFFIARALDDFHMSPEGSMDLRGIMASTWFCRGVLDKVGIEPQVQRLGKYKSYGDILNSTSMSQEQREVVSSLLSETARYWVQVLSQTSNITKPELYGLWSEKANRDAYVCKQRGLVSGVLYKDQVEHLVQHTHRAPQLNILNQWQNNASTDAIERYRNISVFKQDFNLTNHFEIVPRRSLTNHTTTSTTKTSTSSNATSPAAFFTRLIPLKYSNPPLYPANTYLSKMRLASRILPNLPVYEATFGPRIAVINCVGSITVGESYGESLGSDSVIAQIRKAREDKDIRAVVVRIDSPGGSVLASDLVWRELRMLSKDKPVVASMADIAASGGYYFAMACDQIVADQMTVTGSIGVVTAKYNAQELARKIGLNIEIISIGKYAELNTRSRGFHWEEQQLFEEFAQASYKSFVAKAAASRNMSYDSMHAVAQGRAWTGRQAFDRGLVDILGGFWKALEVAAKLSEYYPTKTPTNMVAPIRIHTFSDYKMDLAAQFIGWQQTKNCPSRLAKDSLALAMCPDEVSWTGLAAPESLGISPVMQKLGVSPTLAHWLRQELPAEVAEPFLSALSTAEGSKRVGLGGMLQGFLSSLAKWLL